MFQQAQTCLPNRICTEIGWKFGYMYMDISQNTVFDPEQL